MASLTLFFSAGESAISWQVESEGEPSGTGTGVSSQPDSGTSGHGPLDHISSPPLQTGTSQPTLQADTAKGRAVKGT